MIADGSTVATLTLSINDGHAVGYDGVNIWVTSSVNPPTIVKVDPSGSMSETSSASLSELNGAGTDDFALVGDYVWVGCEGTAGIVAKVKKSDLSIVYVPVGMNTSCFGLFYSGYYVWGAFTGSPGRIVRIDPTTHDIAYFAMESGENNTNEIVFDGQRLFITCYLNPGKIVRLTSPSLNPLTSVRAISTSPYSVTVADKWLGVNTSVVPVTVNLLASPAIGQTITIKDVGGVANTNNITVTPAAGNIDGVSSYVINIPRTAITFVYTGSEWSIT